MQKLILKISIFSIFCLTSLNAQTKNENEQLMLKLSKSFELYGAIFRELVFNYVVDIEPEKLMNVGIEGMLSALDPYTSYLPPSDNDEIDGIMSDNYIGIGIQTDTLDSMLTITEIYKNSPASKAGIRPGDKIHSIDGQFLLYSDGFELRKKTLGKKGTSLSIKLLRESKADTIELTVERDEIELQHVSSPVLLTNNVGYLKINQFAMNAAQAFKTAFIDLYMKNKIKGLVIDVRGNPGGLINSAVEICEFFVPHGIEIVRTMGKNSRNRYTYQTLGNPIDTLIPLVIIINESSASASEILAGAMQDLDRAVILGSRSFGKGLVQSVQETPDGGSLRITNSKYYIPSGRCIQKLDYRIAKDNNGLALHHDSLFYTKNGRPVVESSGIIPDIQIKSDSLNEFRNKLEEGLFFFRFANKFTGNLDSIHLDFKANEDVIEEFNKFLRNAAFVPKHDYKGRLSEILEDAAEIKDKKLLSKISNLAKEIGKYSNGDYEQNKSYIQKRLTEEILLRFYPSDLIEEQWIKEDKVIQKAISIIENDESSLILKKSQYN